MAYATLDDLKTELRISGTGEDALLTSKLDEAQRIIEQVYHRRFEASTEETRFVDYSAQTVQGRSLLLPWDVCRVSEIRNGDGEVVPVAAYVTTPRLRSVSDGASIMVDVPEWWPWYAITLKQSSRISWTYDSDPEEAIAITGKFAFSEAAPANVKSATVRLAYWLYQQRDVATDLPTQPSKQGKMLTPADLPQDVQLRLKGLRRL